MNATPGNNKSSRKTKKDAFQQTNLENSSPTKSRRIHQHHWEKRDNLNLFQPGLRVPTLRWPANPPSRKTSERRITYNKRDLSQGWQRTTTFQDQATFLQKVKQKEEEPASSKKHFLFIQGSPITQVALNRWYKNERSPRNTHLDITTTKRNISLETS